MVNFAANKSFLKKDWFIRSVFRFKRALRKSMKLFLSIQILFLIYVSFYSTTNAQNESCQSSDNYSAPYNYDNSYLNESGSKEDYSKYLSTSGLEAQEEKSVLSSSLFSKGEKKNNAFPLVDYKHWEEHNVQEWKFQVMPLGLIYPSYLAGRKEPRLGCVFTDDQDYGWLWDIQLGGRVPLLRYGTTSAIQPEGFQIDMEGAALLRLDFERHNELAGTDYRAGLPITYGTQHWQYKLAYYHVSSHLGDNYLMEDYRKRVHYVRDEIVFGLAWRPVSTIRVYGEAGWAFHTGTTTDPWEFQFGAEYSAPYHPNNEKGSPFLAVNAHLFEELQFSGYLNLQGGWQWRSATNSLFRLGLEYYDGCDDLFQFHTIYQRKIGLIVSYDY